MYSQEILAQSGDWLMFHMILFAYQCFDSDSWLSRRNILTKLIFWGTFFLSLQAVPNRLRMKDNFMNYSTSLLWPNQFPKSTHDCDFLSSPLYSKWPTQIFIAIFGLRCALTRTKPFRMHERLEVGRELKTDYEYEVGGRWSTTRIFKLY